MREMLRTLVCISAVGLIAVAGAGGCGDDDDEVTVIATLVDSSLSTGSHGISWTQKDDVGEAVSAGTYTAHVVMGDFEKRVGFEIRADAPEVPLECPDGGGVPTGFDLRMDTLLYSLGDTVCITCVAKNTGHVLLTIEQ